MSLQGTFGVWNGRILSAFLWCSSFLKISKICLRVRFYHLSKMSLQETIVEGMLRSELCPWGVKQSLSYLKNTGNFHPVLWLENYFRRDYNHQLANLPMISFDFGICSAWYQYHQSLHPCHFRLQNSSSPSDLSFKWISLWFKNHNCKWKIKDNLFIEPEKSISSKR